MSEELNREVCSQCGMLKWKGAGCWCVFPEDYSGKPITASEVKKGWAERMEAGSYIAPPILGPVFSNKAIDVQVGGDHYKGMAIQPVEFIHANGIRFLEGCVIKRVCRHKQKNGREDLEKAIHELELLIDLEYGKDAG